MKGSHREATLHLEILKRTGGHPEGWKDSTKNHTQHTCTGQVGPDASSPPLVLYFDAISDSQKDRKSTECPYAPPHSAPHSPQVLTLHLWAAYQGYISYL